MNYEDTNGGRVASEASDAGTFWTFDAVEERLVEALQLWHRSPDRERGWQTVRAYWPEIIRHTFYGDYADLDATKLPPAHLPLTRAEVAEMEKVGEWIAYAPDRDRRLVALGLACLARGDKQIPWMKLRRAMGVTFGAHGLRKRYSRAITAIANELNRAENRHVTLSTPVMTQP